jgi:hypothetical protein
MAERTDFHLWLHALSAEDLVALRARKMGTLSPGQVDRIAKMPRAFVEATTRKDTNDDGDQG